MDNLPDVIIKDNVLFHVPNCFNFTIPDNVKVIEENCFKKEQKSFSLLIVPNFKRCLPNLTPH